MTPSSAEAANTLAPASPARVDVIAWLLQGEAALRWQVERDLMDAPEEIGQETRSRVPHEGCAAVIIGHQDPDGQWDGGAFFPGDLQPGAEGPAHQEPGQPWTATYWSLLTLREWGVEPDALREDTASLLEANSRWEYDDLPFWEGEVDACINAGTLANGSWLGRDVSGLETWFVEHQMAEGGWNCDWVEGSQRASFHSTLNTLVGLLDHEARTGATPALVEARHRAQEYLLQRELMRSRTTGEVHTPWATHWAYPFRYYSVIRAADHFRAAALHDGVGPDPRMEAAVEHIRQQRQADGTWRQQLRHEGRAWCQIDVDAGQPSPWLTFTALRVLEWWDASR
ncbi:prenyltransferase/squalene oxidase repeat-containing protein [Mariniluteicoccus flavus]